jgi:hypothetical protein
MIGAVRRMKNVPAMAKVAALTIACGGGKSGAPPDKEHFS